MLASSCRYGEHIYRGEDLIMNKIIKQQLSSCKVANIPEFTDDTTELFILKNSTAAVNSYHLNKYFQIEIADYILYPSPEFTLAANWNNGSNPPSKIMNVEVINIQGKMVQVSGVSFDPTNPAAAPYFWQGWLPQKGLKIIKQL